MTKTQKQKGSKICFLITPIGSDESLIRNRVDQWMNEIYAPAIGKQYEIIRADRIASPGIITEQIIEYIINADLVIIDYTGLNANVMYEAAIRHLIDKPYIQIRENGINFPFDIQNLRAISYDPNSLSYPKQLITEIKKSLKEIDEPAYKQPQIIKEKFDFNKITSDPEKFVSLLRDHIIFSNGGKKPKAEEAIVTIADTFPFSASQVPVFGSKKIVCPKCKTIKYENNNGFTSPAGGLSLSSNIYYASGYHHHYKCNNCGTEFES